MKTFKVFSIACIIIAATATAIICSEKQRRKNSGPLVFNYDSTGYTALWKSVDSLASKGLTRSVLEIADGIYEKAKKEKNAPQLIKAVLHKLKFESYIEEENYIQSIHKLSTEIETAEYPIKPVLHSVLAGIYWQYYTTNRWRFNERSRTVAFKPEDIRTWDLKRIAEKTLFHFQQSLKEADKLKRTEVDIYDEIMIVEDKSLRKLRPTLYDFLAHRAVDFFINEEVDLIRPAYTFEIDDPQYFSPANTFIKMSISSRDSFSLQLKALHILQDLLAFHKNDSDPAALIDADLKRLKFVQSKAVVEKKDELYLNALNTLEKKHKAHPSHAEIIYEIALVYYEKGGTYKPLVSDTNKWMLKKAHDLCAGVISKTEDISYGVGCCKSLKSIIEQKHLRFTVEEGNVPDKPFRALLSCKNISDIYIRIVKTDPLWYYKTKRKLNNEKLIGKILGREKIRQWRESVENDGDFQQHALELKIPALPHGFYIILIGTDSDFSYKKNAVAYTPCWVSQLSYIHRTNTKSETEYFILDRSTGTPLKNVSAQMYFEKYHYKTREYEFKKGRKFITDSNGYFLLPAAKKNRSYFIELTRGNDKLHTERLYNSRFYPRQENTRLKTYFFTDRAIYRPGQTVYFKGIMLEQQGDKTDIKTNYETTVTFYDYNHQKIEDVTLVSNEYGTFSGTFTAPTGVVNGRMTLNNGHGYTSFLVEEYKRPKFEVTIDSVEGEYRLNDRITVKGTAKAHAGSNVDNASFSYRVVRNTVFPHWWYFCRWFLPPAPEVEIANGSGTTDEKGAFTVQFKALPDRTVSKESDPKFHYTVYVDVTDINGETHSAQHTVIAGYTSLNLSVAVPEQVNKAKKDTILINTTNLAGTYQYAQGTITVHKLTPPDRLLRVRKWDQPDRHHYTKDDYVNAFPFDPYRDESNVTTWEKGKEVYKRSFDTKKDSLFMFKSLKKWEPGQYVLEAHTKDRYGTPVKDIKYFTVFSTKEKAVPQHTFDWFALLKNKAEPGETVPLLIGSKAKKVSLFYEIEHDEKIIHKEWITLSSEQVQRKIFIKEAYRGNIVVHVTFVKENRSYRHDAVITVPFTNKELDLEFMTFRNKLLPGQEEEWKLKIKGKKGEKVAAELLAGMYDASLDAFTPHNWYMSIYKAYHSKLAWQVNHAFTAKNSRIIQKDWNEYYSKPTRHYDRLNFYGFDYHHYRPGAGPGHFGSRNGGGMLMMKSASNVADMAEMEAAPPTPKLKAETVSAQDIDKSFEGIGGLKTAGTGKIKGTADMDLSAVKTRTNFNETAFFFPHLETNRAGDVIISFTIPEALTKWKFMGLAHTKDLKIGRIEKEVVTRKELMVMPNPPRFFRENDKITFSTKISNIADKNLSGTARLMLFDALTMKPVDSRMNNSTPKRSFTAKKGQSAAVSWDLTIPEGLQAVTYRIIAKAGTFSDGEEMAVPVLTDRMLVTESLPLPIRGNQTKNYTLKKLVDSEKSKTLKNHKLTLEYTANPAWYAVQALPYLMAYPYECTEQIFSRFYANSIASYIANSSPRIRQVFDSWKNITPDALLSNLEKNQELKGLLLQETPWVLQAKDESQRKRNVGLLFDLNRMANELRAALNRLQKMQVSNGGWPWFPGMPDSRYITQHIVTGMGHLDKLGIKNVREDSRIWNMVKRAVNYCDDRIREDYERLLKYHPNSLDSNHLGRTQIQYLYARSYFLDNIKHAKRNKKAFTYFKGQARKYWLENNRYLQGMIALALHRMEDKQTPPGIIKSLKENAIFSEEMGMYWNDIRSGYYWYQAPIETIALLIEAFDEVANDTKSVEAMKVWLMKNKQTNDWKTTKATTEACYALLLRGTDWLAREPDIAITVGSQKVEPEKLPEVKVEAGTGYFKTSWAGSDIKPEMGKVTVKKGDEGVSWGALYWQYFEQLDKITTHKTPLKLKKRLFIERNTPSGPVIEPVKPKNLRIGDKIIVRIELRVDRDMEYIHLKDMRAAGFEPINVISRYKYQDGLGYYESTKDASTNFFIGFMPKGTYVFEYPLRVSHKGDFSNGITTIQCMYAPEFSSHSEGIRVKVIK